MSDIVEDVAKGILTAQERRIGSRYTYETLPSLIQDDFLSMAEAAIAAATPHIRAALFDDLIADSEKEERQGIEGIFETFAVDCPGCTSGWLRYKKEQDQP